MKRGEEKDWQRDPNTLKSDRVQYWLASGTMLGLRDLDIAKSLVQSRRAFVVSSQAIGEYDPEPHNPPRDSSGMTAYERRMLASHGICPSD